MRTVVQVLRTSRDVAERLRGAPGDAGSVHSVFERVVNVDWHDGRLLALQGPGPLLAPFTASLARLPRSPALYRGQPVHRLGEMLALEGFLVDVRGAALADTAMPAAPSPPHPALLALPAPSRVARGLSSPIGCRARSRLAEGVRGRDPAAVMAGALGLIGLGEGLTPAGDDCLVGTLAVLHRFAPSWLAAHREVRAMVDRAALAATTRIAREFIAHALAGHFADTLIALLTAESAHEVDRAAADLWRSGATSGADTVLGVHLALAALFPRALSA
jgi:hypothetical protein